MALILELIMSTTYAQLKADVQVLSGVTDAKTVALIPRFILSAENKLDGDLRCPGMIVTETLTGADNYPLDLMEIDTILIDGREGRLVPIQKIIMARKLDTPETDAIYGMFGTSIYLVKSGEVMLSGYQKPPRLSETTPTSAYTDFAENALLWSSLAHLYTYRKDQKAASAHGTAASQEIANINAQFDRFNNATGVAGDKPKRRYF